MVRRGGGGDDTIFGGGIGKVQSHLYGGAGDDVIYFDTSSRSAPFGDHAWGGQGNDEFVFHDTQNGSERITGRIDDFDISRDEIWIDDKVVDFQDLPDGVRVVEYADQPWILVGERILYALEGARQNADPGLDRDEEIHFIDWPKDWLDGVPASANISYEDFVDFFPSDQIYRPESDFKKVQGSAYGDQLTGSAKDEIFSGGDGSDVIKGGGGHDLIDGNEGHDTIYGGLGGDSIAGGLDNDLIYGGSGEDIIYGGSGNDAVYGDADGDILYGNNGDDSVYGGKGGDTLFGGLGDDTLYGGEGNDHLIDYNGKNTIVGGDGDDVVEASGGSSIHLGSGSDTLVLGRPGGDYANNPTIVHDISGGDVIDLSALKDGESNSPIKVRIENISISGKTDGLLLTVEGDVQISSVLVDGSGFKGIDSLNFGENANYEIEDLREIDATKVWNQNTNEIRSIPSTDPTDPDDDLSPIDGEDPDHDPVNESSEDSGGGGGCFVATAAYGDCCHPDVVALRAFRDLHLCRYRAGRAFIAFYWIVGPRLASLTTPESIHGSLARMLLSRLVIGLRFLRLTG